MIKTIVLFLMLLCVFKLYNTHVYVGNVWFNDFYVNNKSQIQKQRAVEILQKLKTKCSSFIHKLHSDKHDRLIVNNVNRLISQWSGELRELDMYTRTDVLKGNTLAYNTNKGESISICLFDNDNVPNEMNEIFYVILHELAHVMTNKYEHNTEFDECFKYLVDKAVSYKMYEKIDYAVYPTNFCDTVMEK
jgi:hypothetical protein